MSNIGRSVLNGYFYWNSRLEKGTESIVHASTSCVPNKVRNFVTEKFFNESKMFTHLLLTAAWLEFAFASSFLPPTANYVLGGVTILTLGPLCSYIKEHCQKFSGTSLKARIIAVASPALLILGSLTLLNTFGFFSNSFFSYRDISVLIGTGFGITSLSLGSNVLLLHSEEDTVVDASDEVIDLDNGDPIEQEARREIIEIEAEIRQLKKTLRDIDGFINSHPRLKDLCEKAIREGYTGVYSLYIPPDTSDYDLDNAIDLSAKMSLERNHLERQIEERQIFLQRNREVRECVEQILREQGTSQQPHETLPLLLKA